MLLSGRQVLHDSAASKGEMATILSFSTHFRQQVQVNFFQFFFKETSSYI